jgi:seryl-tRNA synthetase
VLDPALLRDRFDDVRATLQKRGANLDAELQSLASLEAERRRLLPEVEGLKREQNAAAEEVARAKKQGLDTTAIRTPTVPAHSGSSSWTPRSPSWSSAAARPRWCCRTCRTPACRRGTSADDNVEVRRHGTPAHVAFTPQRTGISDRRSASSTSSVERRSRPRASRC